MTWSIDFLWNFYLNFIFKVSNTFQSLDVHQITVGGGGNKFGSRMVLPEMLLF